jgi:hypothetical protein
MGDDDISSPRKFGALEKFASYQGTGFSRAESKNKNPALAADIAFYSAG